MMISRRFFLLTSAFFLFAASPAQAQLAPTPKKSPRTPVSQEVLSGKTTPLAPSHVLSGTATVLDSDRLRLNDVEVRLFGVVPPQTGASYGPQARALVDSLAKGSTTCQIKDRTREGHYLALCSNDAGADFGLELLRRGLAACARGSLRGTPYDAPYQAAEAAAQNQKLGLWSGAMPAAASESSIRAVMAKADAAKAEAEKAKAEAERARAELEKAKAELGQMGGALPSMQTTMAQIEGSNAPTVVRLNEGTATAKPPIPTTKPDLAVNDLQPPTADEVQAVIEASQNRSATAPATEIPFVERYQMLLSSLLLFGASMVGASAFVWNKARQRKEDLRTVAAALHGELMAARSVCKARLTKIAQEGDEDRVPWPRLRVIVFQAYIGKLGCLGAELSRKIASIYGMAGDYASYYNSAASREGTSKKQALEMLVSYIEEITPRLSKIEKEGCLPTAQKPGKSSVRLALNAPAQTTSRSLHPAPPSPPRGKKLSEAKAPPSIQDVTRSLAQAKTEIVAETGGIKRALQSTDAKAQKAFSSLRKAALSKTALRQTLHVDEAAQAAKKAIGALNLKAPIIERLAKMKAIAADKIEASRAAPAPIDDFSIPDYANLTEEELEALLYAEEELTMASPVGKWRQVG